MSEPRIDLSPLSTRKKVSRYKIKIYMHVLYASMQLCIDYPLTSNTYVVIDAKYVHLESLDLINHCPYDYDLWINEVEAFLHYGCISCMHVLNLIQLRPLIDEQNHCCSYPKLSSENDSTDATILYL